jgi:hypothetical protein
MSDPFEVICQFQGREDRSVAELDLAGSKVVPAEGCQGLKCKSGVSGKMPTELPSQLEALVDLLLVYVSARFITNETVTFLPVPAVAAVRN